ncbi:MAG: hypothetical protein Q8M94_03020 [Ignavibacteria bacterium]|nr:hypothetical protein [Ignavibacteria bacterium]
MATITVFVRSPISGYITGRTKYCIPLSQGGDPVCTGSGNPHNSCAGGVTPVDIGGSGSLYLRVNYPNVLSIRTFIALPCCPGQPDNYRRAITVELYGKSNGVCYIGSVRYAHVASPAVSHNTLYNLSSGSKLLGTVPTGSAGSCYSGPHSHMERTGGVTVAPCCGATVSTSTNIYRYTWDDAACMS